MLDLDPRSEFGARVVRRLEREEVAWLTTVGVSGTPRPAPIWFLWEEGVITIYSEPNQAKVRNIERHPRVSFHFNSNAGGDDIVVLTGVARIAPEAPPIIDNPAYLAKYRNGIAGIGLLPASMSATYSTAILFTPDHLRGH